MNLTLVIMAAGLGSRYGGNKQIDGIGPHGELLMEYAVYDALRAGFRRVVFVIKRNMEPLMRSLCQPWEKRMEVRYVFQEFDSIPAFYTVPPERVKPFGTVHALLCAEEAVSEPFCVINADDYYGAESFGMMARALAELPEKGQAVMIGYLLRNTASLHGSVSRGICMVENGLLRSVDERKRIQLYPDNRLVDLDRNRELDPDSVVSMNFWGFMPSIFPVLRRDLETFLRRDDGTDLRSERLLPGLVDQEIREGRLQVAVLPTVDVWFGMTYREDRNIVADELARLHNAGLYPPALRE